MNQSRPSASSPSHEGHDHHQTGSSPTSPPNHPNASSHQAPQPMPAGFSEPTSTAAPTAGPPQIISTQRSQPCCQSPHLVGYVSNARNAPAQSELFQFWAPIEQEGLGIGSIVRHHSSTDHANTYAMIIDTLGRTIGLDDYATDFIEKDAQLHFEDIRPSTSTRPGVINYTAKVLASSRNIQRPVSPGPVYAVTAPELALLHGKKVQDWIDPASFLNGFYEDLQGTFGIFAEERMRVLGPKQGHLILSGVPGSGKTSLFLTLVICEYAHLRQLARDASPSPPPRVATVAFNVKGADLLFIDHSDLAELEPHDAVMWQTAEVDVHAPPFGRVIIYTPLRDDCLNRNSLRTNPAADVPGYSETREFSLGIQDLWPYLDLFFDKRTTNSANLLAEIASYFEEEAEERFTLANVLTLLKTQVNLPASARREGRWADFPLSTIRAVAQRLRSLPALLGGLIDITGEGFGICALADNLRPYDMVIVDLDSVMTGARDLEGGDNILKIVTAYLLKQLTATMTHKTGEVDHIIVFADELNRLAPREGESGIGEYLAQIARTTRDRGVVLFGAGQFRSGIHEDLLKAAAIHYSLQTPEQELTAQLYRPLSEESRARLTRLKPGEALLHYPTLRTAVFARFPLPFLLTGGKKWLELFPEIVRPFEDCLTERLTRLDPSSPPQLDEVCQLIQGLGQYQLTMENGVRPDQLERGLVELLRDIEIARVTSKERITPWAQFAEIARAKYGQPASKQRLDTSESTPPSFFSTERKEWE
jgi:uncharacterized protein